MFELSVLAVFLAASIALILSPGPDSVYVLTRGMSGGATTGVAAAAGTSTGILVHTTAAVLGLSLLLRTSEIAFSVVQYLGAAYLCYLGIETIRNREEFEIDAGTEMASETAFARGTMINVLNPQVAVFFLAFLPQFAGPGSSASLQMLLLGALYAVLTMMYLSFVALVSDGFRRLLRTRPQIVDGIRWLTGSVLVALGLQLFVSDPIN